MRHDSGLFSVEKRVNTTGTPYYLLTISVAITKNILGMFNSNKVIFDIAELSFKEATILDEKPLKIQPRKNGNSVVYLGTNPDFEDLIGYYNYEEEDEIFYLEKVEDSFD